MQWLSTYLIEFLLVLSPYTFPLGPRAALPAHDECRPFTLIDTVLVGKQPSGLSLIRFRNLGLIANRVGNCLSVLRVTGKNVTRTHEVEVRGLPEDVVLPEDRCARTLHSAPDRLMRPRILAAQVKGRLDGGFSGAIPGGHRHLLAWLPVVAALPVEPLWQLGVKPGQQHQRAGRCRRAAPRR